MTKQFGMSQFEAFEKGKRLRQRHQDVVYGISLDTGSSRYPHVYIFSPPGLGKTYLMNQHLSQSNTPYLQVSGNVSMFALGIRLAVINYNNRENERIIILVDDCDEIFKNEINCNIMKNVLDGIRTFKYEKSLQSQWSSLSDIQQEAIKFHQEEGQMGFNVQCDKMQFVFNSNFKLPTDDEVRIARQKGGGKSILIAHKNAIRSRCRVLDFDLKGAEHYGWIADVVMNTDCLQQFQFSDVEKQIILDFLWYNWSTLTERSIRLVEKMSENMVENPMDYQEIWEMEFTKNSLSWI